MIRASMDTEEWTKVLSRYPKALTAALEDLASTFKTLAEGRTPVKTGFLKRSWSGIDVTSTGFSFGTNVSYAEILEKGLYKSVGKRTVEFEGGIYSRQAPGGILGPLLTDEAKLVSVLQLFLKKMEAEMSNA